MRAEDPTIGLVLGEKVQVRVVRRIGEGGMGTVYAAESTTSGLPYAVKLLQPRLCQQEQALRRLFREAIVASSIHHPGIVSVVDTGRLADGAGYYVMELLRGEDLAATLRREQRLPWSRALHIALQICDAMAMVHAHAIVHRDLKPANCFRMARGDDLDAIKILDFGVAKIAAADASTLTGVDAFLGTIPYMAPELLRANGAREGDARGDIWALAVTIHELLTGTRPFHADNVFALIATIQDQPPASLAATAPDWPAGLQAVLTRALDKDPRRRFADMNAMALALRELDTAAPTQLSTVAAADPLAATVEFETPAAPGIPRDDDATRAPTPHAEPAVLADVVRSIRERSALYVEPSSRWRPDPQALPGGTYFAVVRGDLCLEHADAIVCGVAREGLQRGTPAWRLCEFGGPTVGAIASAIHHLADGAVHRVRGGRLAAAHVFFVVQPEAFASPADARDFIARVVAQCLDLGALRMISSLSVPLFLQGSSGVSQRFCLESIIEQFALQLASAPPFTLGTLRVVIDDRGERLTRHGGELIVRLPEPPVASHEAVQRFALSRYPTMAALAAAIWESIPEPCRPPFAGYGAGWSLWHGEHALTPAALFAETATPETVGIVPGTELTLGLAMDPTPAAPDLPFLVPTALLDHCAVVDWTLVTDGTKGRVPLLCSRYRNIQAVVNDVWWAFPEPLRPRPFSYGESWALRNQDTGELVPLTPHSDLAASGFVRGATFEVVWLR